MAGTMEPEAPLDDLAPPKQVVIHTVGFADIGRWLGAGWRDFRRAGGASLFFGLLVIAVAFVLTGGLFMAGLERLIVPLSAGFLLIGPFLTVGLYELSRQIERGEAPDLAAALMAWRANPRNLLGLGLALAMIAVLWARLSAMMFPLSYPHTAFDVRALIEQGLSSPAVQGLLLIGASIGAILAALVFAACIVGLPLMLDRRTGLIDSLIVSVDAALHNLPVMVAWAVVIVLLCVVGMLAAYVGLAVVVPVIGHASWHAYRALVSTDDADDAGGSEGGTV